ncbi:DNA (cytosine-5)-methyltransferase CMT3 [Abrus precatorius]|uniref:Cytosine-specific methyltransferase n=1 Tax=Abrus precatorius TaxID=3816 RepID=A0A8B8LNB7_ABRPR|nr:DNA (cytosine-5)-methyltransferase CMT3 [Abrus precatorius]
MSSKRRTRSSSVASGDSAPNKSRRTVDSRSPVVEEVLATSSAVKDEQISFVDASPLTPDEDGGPNSRFVGDPIPDEKARLRWPHRYQQEHAIVVLSAAQSLAATAAPAGCLTKKQSAGSKSNRNVDEEILQARRHYTQAEVDGSMLYKLYDDAHVKAEEGEDNYICKIVEMFEAVDGTLYFTAQWYYRAKDTVIKNLAYLIEPERVFFSEVQDDNPLDCLVEKLNIARIPLNVDSYAKKETLPACDYYCDTQYLLPYSTFVYLPSECREIGSETSSTISSETEGNGKSEVNSVFKEGFLPEENKDPELKLLDLYCGCGAMSTGLCQGGVLSGVNLYTKWAVDLNGYACKSLKLNHPDTEVRNESAENFLSLLKEWQRLCSYFSLVEKKVPDEYYVDLFSEEDDGTCSNDEKSDDENDDDDDDDDDEVFEVSELLAICYGDPNKRKDQALYFKVRWKGYGPDADTWEPIQALSNCKARVKDFVIRGFNSKILPLPGDVDVICGGPPCQGISGFNRFRNKENPLEDEKNKQLVVFMDIVQYLQPKFALMENVVDIVKFANGFLGRYALGRLLQMNYQCRLGIMAAGAYGLPQFRLRVFIWGAAPSQKLPQFPLPTHDVIVRGVIPLEFEINTVAYDEGHNVQLQRKLLLEDAISDLPLVKNNEGCDEMKYSKPAQTEFQQFIRLTKTEMLGFSSGTKLPKSLIYDHRPLELNSDDFQRVCQIPKTKGGCFRDLPGVLVRADNKVEWDPNVERVYLDSGKPLVPDYAMSFVNGTSSKPFARLWWDETVPTVVTRAEPHNQAILHPEQDRVLTIRENARLQGFPDFYKLCGPVKERYIQVGNAVAVPVARALGYTLGLAFQGSVSDGALYKLPDKFPLIRDRVSSVSSEDIV